MQVDIEISAELRGATIQPFSHMKENAKFHSMTHIKESAIVLV